MPWIDDVGWGGVLALVEVQESAGAASNRGGSGGTEGVPISNARLGKDSSHRKTSNATVEG